MGLLLSLETVTTKVAGGDKELGHLHLFLLLTLFVQGKYRTLIDT